MDTLHKAAEDGDLGRVRMLLRAHPDQVFTKDGNGQTPLYLAAYFGHKNVVEMLLAANAEVNAADNRGWTPLHAAAQKGHKDVAEVLLANHANVHARAKPEFDSHTPSRLADLNHRVLHRAEYKDLVDLLKHHASLQPPPSDPVASLKRWKLSGEPQAWVSSHLHGWNQGDWLDLLAVLRQTSYWPMDEAAIGQHLEALRAQLTSGAQAVTREFVLGEVQESIDEPDVVRRADICIAIVGLGNPCREHLMDIVLDSSLPFVTRRHALRILSGFRDKALFEFIHSKCIAGKSKAQLMQALGSDEESHARMALLVTGEEILSTPDFFERHVAGLGS